MTVAARMRILGLAVLVAVVVAGWALRAVAGQSFEQQITILQIKDRAMNASRLAAQIAAETPDPQTKQQANDLSVQARKLFDRAEKVLRP